MAKAKIDAGICGKTVAVEATVIEEYRVALNIVTDCPHITKAVEVAAGLALPKNATIEVEA